MIPTIAFAIAALGLAMLVVLYSRIRVANDEIKLRKHRSTAAGFADLLNYAAMVDDGVIVGKNGSFMAAWLYQGDDNAEHRPVVLHRAIYGSFERFIAILIEHYAGAFPAWLAPTQAVLITVADRHLEYAAQVQAQLRAKGYRVELDDRGQSMKELGYVKKLAPPAAIDWTLLEQVIAENKTLYAGLKLKTVA